MHMKYRGKLVSAERRGSTLQNVSKLLSEASRNARYRLPSVFHIDRRAAILESASFAHFGMVSRVASGVGTSTLGDYIGCIEGFWRYVGRQCSFTGLLLSPFYSLL